MKKNKQMAIERRKLEIEKKKLLLENLKLQFESLKNEFFIYTAHKTCDHCGRGVDFDAQICPYCGKELIAPKTLKESQEFYDKVIIQIEINADPNEDSPFAKGLNKIVVPLSVLKESELNAIFHIFNKEYREYLDQEYRGCLKSDIGEFSFERVPNGAQDAEVIKGTKECTPRMAEEILFLALSKMGEFQ